MLSIHKAFGHAIFSSTSFRKAHKVVADPSHHAISLFKPSPREGDSRVLIVGPPASGIAHIRRLFCI